MKKLLFLIFIGLINLIFNGCAVMAPDQFKWEAGIDDRGKYNGMKTGFSWNLPQPKHY